MKKQYSPPTVTELKPRFNNAIAIRNAVLAVCRNQWYTRAEIARALGRSKSPQVIDAIETLVHEGRLQKRADLNERGGQTFRYTVSAGNKQ